MADREVVLSVDGLKKLEEELEHLRTARRREVAERIKQAREFGDISENSEYDDAKNEQAFIEGRIATLEKTLRNARVLDENDLDGSRVHLGSKVRVRDLDSSEELEFTIVGSLESDPLNDRISNESPVGRALLDQPQGAIVEVLVPAGVIRYEILGINL